MPNAPASLDVPVSGTKDTGMTALGYLVADARERAGLTRAQLADQIGMNRGYFWNVENGARPLPEWAVPKVAERLGIDEDAIWMAMGRIPPDIAATIADLSPSAMSKVRAFLATCDRKEG